MTLRAKRYFRRKRDRKLIYSETSHIDVSPWFSFCMPADVEKALKEANRKFWESMLTEPYLNRNR